MSEEDSAAPHPKMRRYVPGRYWTEVTRKARGALPSFALILVLLILVIYPLLWVGIRGLFSSGQLVLEPFLDGLSGPLLKSALTNTLLISVSVAALAGIFGVFLAWAVARTNMFFSRFVERLVLVPLLTTPLVGAFAWVILAAPRTGLLNEWIFGYFGWEFDIYSRLGIILVMSLYLCPFVFLLTVSAFRQIDPTLEEASVIAGRGRFSSFARITLPLALPALLAALVLTIVQAQEEFGIPAILGLPRGIYMLTTLIYDHMSGFPAQYAEASAVALVLVALAAIFVFAQRRIQGSKRSYATIGGQEFRPSRLKLGRARVPVTAVCVTYIGLAVVLPFLGLFVVSLHGVWTGHINFGLLTFDNYDYLVQSATARRAMINSLKLAAMGAVVATIFTALAAYVIKSRRLRGAGLISFLTTLPVAIPGIVLAIGIFQAYIRPPVALYGTLWILLLAYITRYLPYGMRASEAALEQLGHELEESARICGAGWFRGLRTVVVPLIMPGMLAGATLMFVAMMRELSSSILLYSGPTIVNAVLMIDLWEGGQIERLAALAIVITMISFFVVGLLQRLLRIDIATRA